MQKENASRLQTDLWRAEPCFEIRSLHVLRSSTLLPSVLRADWTSEFCVPPPCPCGTAGEDGEKSSPESSVNKQSGKIEQKRLKLEMVSQKDTYHSYNISEYLKKDQGHSTLVSPLSAL